MIFLRQITLIIICLFIGFVFVSLTEYNEVNYSNILQTLPNIFSDLLIISGSIYFIVTVIMRTKICGQLKQCIKVFSEFEELYKEQIIHTHIYATIVFFLLYSLILKQPQDYPTHTYWAVDLFD